MAGRDTRYLEFHKGKWRASIHIPAPYTRRLGPSSRDPSTQGAYARPRQGAGPLSLS
jgi:hypothetical protein